MSTLDNVKKQHSEAMKSVYGYDDGYIDEEIKSIMEYMTIEVIDEAYHIESPNLNAIIKVKGDEGPVPHFHVEYGGKETCFCIFDSMFANHEPWHVKMDKDQLKALNVFLMSPNKKSVNHKDNYWKEIAITWNKLNPNFKKEIYKDGKLRKPDYSKTSGNAEMGNKYKDK